MQHKTGLIDHIEETVIAALLGMMTLLTFANVIARYVFNTNILWALELTVFMFGWLVLLGASYAVKKHAHLGVDAVINLLSAPARRLVGLLAVGACLFFSLLLLKGCYDYWAVFADLPPTSGRWFPTGFDTSARSQSFYEVQDVPMLAVLRFLEDLINYGDPYEKLPKVVPYLVLPLSAFLLVLRFTQVAFAIWSGKSDRLIASHEVEDEIEQLRAAEARNAQGGQN
ncbi:TRAP transporter small permease [uncultured Roseovarius sp.]|jgi:C4-dicarboxylate transporter DctQ subunit|uniref:TRAP transporter small permease n=1 Tax=uncultured Roseovarius sp. TaxID=293344 RepID=UPI000C3C0AC0|nr:TRAP transporter permease DctQ [Roseovarius sp.]MBD13183.1 TRAP transporter permease DctQ [Roseovarius sp.]|tara:strand:- start:1951 stop:2631 length:681 start_codon:yes stop_codon:yes gene_type:complete